MRGLCLFLGSTFGGVVPGLVGVHGLLAGLVGSALGAWAGIWFWWRYCQ